MKYFVFSDLHGSLSGMERTFAAISREKPDVVVCLGDILYGAFDTNQAKVIELLKSIKAPIIAVKGNCDYPGDEHALGFDLPEYRAFDIGMHTVHLSHRPSYLSFPPGDATLCGHTHIKTLYREGGVIHANPGSVSRPRDDGPSYMIVEDGVFSLVDLDSGETLRSLTW